MITGNGKQDFFAGILMAAAFIVIPAMVVTIYAALLGLVLYWFGAPLATIGWLSIAGFVVGFTGSAWLVHASRRRPERG